MVVLPALFAGQTLAAQQGWPQSPQYTQAYPAQPYAQQQYAPQQYPQQYAQPQAYPQQQAYDQQPYGNPGMADPQQGFAQPQQGGEPFAAEQLEQLEAPIALYPDTLVAQILAASTYPAQVIAADNWIHAQGYATPEQIAAGADAQASWDPSVKALTAFPQVLDLMNRDLHWTTDLGNAYYNQPQDVLQTIQVMRQRAEDAGTLRSTPQETVTYQQGYIQLAPPTPQVVYVPAYNPWDVYGQPVQPYPGFSLIGALESIAGSAPMRYGLGTALSAFDHTQFGWAGWLLNWLTSSIFHNQSPYYSQSTSVAHWGGGGRGGGGNGYGGGYGSQGGGINRQPNGYSHQEQGFNRFGDRGGNQAGAPGFTRPPVRTQENYAYNHMPEGPNRGYAGSYVRPALRDYSYNRPQAPVAQPVRPQTYARPGGYGYGNGFYSNQTQAYAARPTVPYGDPRQGWREPASSYQRNEFAQRSFAEPRGYSGGRGYAESAPKQSGGFHMFGGGHGGESPHYSYKAPKMPKAPKMGGGGHFGGGGHSGGGGHHGGGGLFGHHGR